MPWESGRTDVAGRQGTLGDHLRKSKHRCTNTANGITTPRAGGRKSACVWYRHRPSSALRPHTSIRPPRKRWCHVWEKVSGTFSFGEKVGKVSGTFSVTPPWKPKARRLPLCFASGAGTESHGHMDHPNKAVVEEALRTLIGLKRQEEILALRGKLPGRAVSTRCDATEPEPAPHQPAASPAPAPGAGTKSHGLIMGWTGPADGIGVPGRWCRRPQTPEAFMAGAGKQTVARQQTDSDRS
jgi:hypothetical protein